MVRLLPAYTRDVLTFLCHKPLQECRLVSLALNSLIEAYHFSARRRLFGLDIEVGRLSDLCRRLPAPTICDDGYVEVSKHECKNWKQLQEEWDCCRGEFEEEALSLVGKRILPSHSADSFVELQVQAGHTRRFSIFSAGNSTRSTTLVARNEMTAETAFGVLHLLDHLRGVVFEDLWGSVWDGDSAILVNPTIIQLLSLDKQGSRLCVTVYEHDWWVPDTSKLLKASISYVKIGELKWELNGLITLPQVSDFTLTGRAYCRRLRADDAVSKLARRLYSRGPSELCTPISYTSQCHQSAHRFQHFQTTHPAIGSDAVSELTISRIDRVPSEPDEFWPARLPPKEQMEKLGYDRSNFGNLYRYRIARIRERHIRRVLRRCGAVSTTEQ